MNTTRITTPLALMTTGTTSLSIRQTTTTPSRTTRFTRTAQRHGRDALTLLLEQRRVKVVPKPILLRISKNDSLEIIDHRARLFRCLLVRAEGVCRAEFPVPHRVFHVSFLHHHAPAEETVRHRDGSVDRTWRHDQGVEAGEGEDFDPFGVRFPVLAVLAEAGSGFGFFGGCGGHDDGPELEDGLVFGY